MILSRGSERGLGAVRVDGAGMTRKKAVKAMRKKKKTWVCNNESLQRINENRISSQTLSSHVEAVSGMGDCRKTGSWERRG